MKDADESSRSLQKALSFHIITAPAGGVSPLI